MKSILAGLALAAVAAPAFAGGPVVITPEPEVIVPAAPVQVTPVGGDWNGFYGGAQLGYGSADAKFDGNKFSDADGVVGGVQAGYRWDFGTTVLGLEAAHLGGDLKDDTTGGKLKNTTDLKLQLGYDMGASLLYATAGASWAKAEIGGSSFSDNGWNLGLGYDYDLGNNWIVGGEYLHRKFDNFDGSGADLSADTLTLRANYKF